MEVSRSTNNIETAYIKKPKKQAYECCFKAAVNTLRELGF